jgi:hypothetical protein
MSAAVLAMDEIIELRRQIWFELYGEGFDCDAVDRMINAVACECAGAPTGPGLLGKAAFRTAVLKTET